MNLSIIIKINKNLRTIIVQVHTEFIIKVVFNRIFNKSCVILKILTNFFIIGEVSPLGLRSNQLFPHRRRPAQKINQRCRPGDHLAGEVHRQRLGAHE